MTNLLVLMICFIFHFDPASSLRASTVRELTGLYSKDKHFVSPVTADAGLFPNVSEACRNAILGLLTKPELGKCK